MTCIVGVEDKHGTILGADSIAANYYMEGPNGYTKLFINKPFLFGCSTSFRMIDLLTYELEVTKSTEEDDKFMRTTFLTAVRKCFKKGGFLSKDNEAEIGGSFLVVYNNKIYQILNNFGVLPSQSYGTAVGSGHEVALGSLYSTYNTSLSAKERVVLAVEAACEISSTVKGPIMTRNYYEN